MFGNRTSAEWVAQYASSHQHPVNRLCHTFGIPLIRSRCSPCLRCRSTIAHGNPRQCCSSPDGRFSLSATPLRASRRSSSMTGASFSSACAGGGPRCKGGRERANKSGLRAASVSCNPSAYFRFQRTPSMVFSKTMPWDSNASRTASLVLKSLALRPAVFGHQLFHLRIA